MTDRLFVSRRSISLAVLLAILALVAVAAVLGVRQYNDSRDAAVTELRAKVEIGAATLSAYFAGDLSTLRSIAVSQPVIEGNEQQMHAYLRRIAPPGSAVFTGGLAWLDARGRSRVSSTLPRIAKPIDVSDRGYFKQVMATNAPYVSAGLTSKRTNLRVVVIAVPTHDAGGAINGVLVGAIKVKPAAPSRTSIALAYSGLVILDRAGNEIITGLGRPANGALVARLEQHASGAISDTRGFDGSSGRVVVWASSPKAGWIIAIDRPRSSVFAAARRALILDLALIAGLALLLVALMTWVARRAQREARIQQRHLEHERDIALRLQRSMLPATLPAVDGLDIACRYQAAGEGIEVGGDWYDVVARADGLVHAIVGDVAGRGIVAATLMGQMRSAFHAYAYDHSSPAEVLRRMLRLVPDGAMATAVCLSFDPFTGDLRYASAGHLPPLTSMAPPARSPCTSSAGRPRSGSQRPRASTTSRWRWRSAASLVAYTDGLIERRTESIDVGIDRVARSLAAGADARRGCARREGARRGRRGDRRRGRRGAARRAAGRACPRASTSSSPPRRACSRGSAGGSGAG